MSKSVSGYFKKKKKVPMSTKPRGGGKGLSGRATMKRFFLRLPLHSCIIFIHIYNIKTLRHNNMNNTLHNMYRVDLGNVL